MLIINMGKEFSNIRDSRNFGGAMQKNIGYMLLISPHATPRSALLVKKYFLEKCFWLTMPEARASEQWQL